MAKKKIRSSVPAVRRLDPPTWRTSAPLFGWLIVTAILLYVAKWPILGTREWVKGTT